MKRIVTCPACGFAQPVPTRLIPERTVAAECPHCGGRFPLTGDSPPPSVATDRTVWRSKTALRWGGAALALLLLALALPKPSSWQMLQGRRALQRGDLRDARQHFAAVLAAAPENADARQALGKAFFQEKNYPQAFDCFATAYRADLREQEIDLIPATLLKMQRYDEALAWCERLKADHPQDQALLKKLAKLKRAIKRLQKADKR